MPSSLPSPRTHQSRAYLIKGVLCLVLGSVALLSCKLTLPLWADSFCFFTGAGALLLGNGYMLYGLLMHADNRTYANDMPHQDMQEK